MPKADVLLGMSWGDEGKGKIVDVLARDYAAVVRFNGGPNAGHSVQIGEERFKFHQLPAAVLIHSQEIVDLVIANGSVVDLRKLVDEIEEAAKIDLQIASRIWISDRAHVITPFHVRRDAAAEDARRGSKLGTTRTGNGPAYSSKAARSGVTIGELLPWAGKKMAEISDASIVDRLSGGMLFEEVDEILRLVFAIAPMVTNTQAYLRGMLQEYDILLAGAHGAMLDIDHGTYPFVTSSSCTIGGALTGTGLSHREIGKVIGVAKAYTTRIAAGPLRTEMGENLADHVREWGYEYGTTTGRARRIGWLDLGQLTYAARINGVDSLALTKLDVLSRLPQIKVATSPYAEDADPDYIKLEGWMEDISGVRNAGDLPEQARKLISLVEEHAEVPVELVGVGPGRNQVIRKPGGFSS